MKMMKLSENKFYSVNSEKNFNLPASYIFETNIIYNNIYVIYNKLMQNIFYF